MKYKITEINRQSHLVDVFFENTKGIFNVLLMSDEHWDNKLCKLDVLKRHHEEAVQKKALIFKFGDTFCAMQGKWDKRADAEQLRKEHRGNNYLDNLVNTAADWYKPYAKNIALIGMGNHEQSIVDRHQTNLIDRLTSQLGVKQGGYWGYVTFRFSYHKKLQIKKLFYHHGYGGGGEVTRGLIDNNRTRGQYNADIFYSGHIHRRNMDENIITDVTSKGNIVQREQLFLRGSTYKNETSGWHSAGGRASRPIGGWWIEFSCTRTSNEIVIKQKTETAT